MCYFVVFVNEGGGYVVFGVIDKILCCVVGF